MTIATRGGVGLAALWRLLSLGFMSPTRETVAEVEVLADGLADLGPEAAIEDLLQALRECGVDELAVAYNRLFAGAVVVSPYEGSYEADPLRQGRQMADVAAFYGAFGAGAHGPASERPDHAGSELEFLSYLELRRLAALEDGDGNGAELVDGIATTFLREHAGRWLPAFFAEVREASRDMPVYRAFAALGEETVAAEVSGRGITCEPLPRRRERLPVERDRFECG